MVCSDVLILTFTSLTLQFFSEGRIHIQLRDLPRSALPTDVRRLCIRERLLGVTAGKSVYL